MFPRLVNDQCTNLIIYLPLSADLEVTAGCRAFYVNQLRTAGDSDLAQRTCATGDECHRDFIRELPLPDLRKPRLCMLDADVNKGQRCADALHSAIDLDCAESKAKSKV